MNGIAGKGEKRGCWQDYKRQLQQALEGSQAPVQLDGVLVEGWKLASQSGCVTTLNDGC